MLLYDPNSPPERLIEAWHGGRLAVLWAAAPFKLVDASANQALAINRWQAEAAILPDLEPFLDARRLPGAPILSLDPTERVQALFRRQQVRLSLVRGPSEASAPGEHGLYPLAGELAGRAGLLLTLDEIANLWQDDAKYRGMLVPWLMAARAGAVLILGAQSSSPVLYAWWEAHLARGLQGVPVYAVGSGGTGWPAGVSVVAATWPELLAFVGQPENGEDIVNDVPGTLTPGQRRRLQDQLRELQAQYDTLLRRIAALNSDIGRETDSERKLTLEERKAELVAERQQVSDAMDAIEARFYTAGQPSGRPGARADPEPGWLLYDAVKGVDDQRAALQAELEQQRSNLQELRLQRAKYGVRVPLDLINEIKDTEAAIERVLTELAELDG